MRRQAQSLLIHQAVASATGALLQRLLIAGELRIFATHLDRVAGSPRSASTTAAAARRAGGGTALRRPLARPRRPLVPLCTTAHFYGTIE